MIDIRMQEHIAVSRTDVLDFVMDIESYAEVDTKIRPILWSRREGDRVEFACRPMLAGMRQPEIVQSLDLTPGERVDIRLLPLPQNRLAHAMADFEASFVCEAVPGGTLVTRRLRFTFAPFIRWLLEPRLRRRLPGEVRDELLAAKAYLEDRASGATRP